MCYNMFPFGDYMVEKWRPVITFEDWYEVSNYGRVRRIAIAANGGSTSKPGKILKPYVMPHGYWKYILGRGTAASRKNVLAHWLVAEAFIGPRPKGMQIHHIDHNGSNNRIDNLKYMTPGEHLTITNQALNVRYGEAQHLAKLTVTKVQQMRELSDLGMTGADVGRLFGVSTATACRVIKRKTWKHAA